MLTDFAFDQVFTIAWFGLMTLVWFGWAQEDPPGPWRWRLAVGSGIGLLLIGAFGYAVVRRWNDGSALEGRYEWFGVLTGLEVLVAVIGCLYLRHKGRSRWMAWWVAVVVAVHFVPLALLLGDASLVVLAIIELVALGAIVPRLRRSEWSTSRLVGPVMGVSLVVFGMVSAVMFLISEGSPWA